MNGVAHIFNAILNIISIIICRVQYIYITQIYKNSQDRIEATRGVIYQKQEIGTEIDVDLIPVN